MVDVPGRDKKEKAVAAAVRKGFKPFRKRESRRQPPWAQMRVMIEPLDKVLDKVRLDAARFLALKMGGSPLPPDWHPPASERGKELLSDLVATSRRRWKALKRPLQDEDIEAWRKQNLGEERLRLIAATEVTMAHQQGEEAALIFLKAHGAKIESYWMIEPGACSICAPLANQPRKVWMKTAPLGPPAHVACRCHLRHVDMLKDAKKKAFSKASKAIKSSKN